jgi:hypothetical protein
LGIATPPALESGLRKLLPGLKAVVLALVQEVSV